jgi:glutathione-regulated potassium-efflux system ancillary protein KefC
VAEGSLLRDTIVYLGAAVICVPIASRLKLGSVLGYLGAGCLIGPFGLRLVGDPAATLHFAEIGVVLMLFVIGLELDPKRLWAMRRAVFGGGALQLGLCGALLAVGGLALGLGWQAALVAGLALGLSSTAVVMQTMSERNLQTTAVGTSTFSILLFQDIAAIPLVAIVPLLAESGSAEGSSWLGAAKALGAIVAVFVIGRFLTRPVLRIVAKTGMREVFTGFTLLLVLGIAALMAGAGVSMALGAFLAGVLLAGSEYRHALEADIEPFKGLLMGLFFIAVGMSIDFAFLVARPLAVLTLVVGFQLVKGLGLRAIAGPIGVAPRQRWLFMALLVQGGEFAFVVFGVARSARLLPGEWDALLTLTVALSMALTPLLLIAYDRAAQPRKERPADTIEPEDAPVIIAGFGRFGQIVGRLLLASGHKATVLDHDPDTIDLLRRFDFRVYYGDATRIDLLEAAGAAEARLIVVAIDDMAQSVALVDTVRHAFPALRIVARARNVGHYHALRSRGVEIVERETFESALRLGRAALGLLGHDPYEAREVTDRFRRHNIAMIEQILPHFEDEQRRTEMARAARRDLEEQLGRDLADLGAGDGGWQSGAEREPARPAAASVDRAP